MFSDYRRKHFQLWAQRQKQRRAQQLAARQATLPLTADKRRIIDALHGWLNSGSSLWIATSMVFKSESDFCQFVRSALADPRESLRSEVRKLLAVPWLHESGENGDHTPAKYYQWQPPTNRRLFRWRDF